MTASKVKMFSRLLTALLFCAMMSAICGAGYGEEQTAADFILPSFEAVELERYRALTVGDQGEDVLAVKEGLSKLGYMRQDIAFSRTYSEATAQAIAQFQSDYALEATGIADPTTQALLKYLTAKEDEQSAPVRSVPDLAVSPYIGNKNTKKFHKRNCSSIGQMKESNKVPFDTRDAAVNSGYVPCKRCNP